MGVAGAGYGTAAANMLRCTISILYLCKKTDIFRCKGAKIRKQAESEGADVLYLTVEPQDAVEASQSIRRYAEERGYPKRLAYRAALCMEEMIHYVVDAEGSDRVNTQLMIRFSPESCIFTIMDDGRCIMFDEDDETKELITNYSLIRKIATSVSYQYILNLNYSVFEFRDAA